MNIKDYQMEPKKPLTFEEWKGNIAPRWSDEQTKALNRLHKIDTKKEFDEMLQQEYAEYCSNLNGNWLLK
jgi:hypothetical protein